MRQERIRTQFTTPRPDRRRRTRAFTLIELLVVITLIALLMSLLVVASMSVVGTSREAATKATITKIDGMLKERLHAFTAHKTDPVLASIWRSTANNTDPRRADVIARKIEFRRCFPQTWSEAVWAKLIDTAPSSTPDAESSEVLYLVLTTANVLGLAPVDTDAFQSSEVKDTNGNGKKEFVDGWGKPIRFYRWPTRLIRPGTTSTGGGFNETVDTANAQLLLGSLGATDLTKDPDDAVGLLTTSDWATGSIPDDFETNGLPNTSNRIVFHTLGTFHAPLLVSAGADDALGLFEPSDSTNHGYLARKNQFAPAALYDNITNHNIRAGATR